MCHELYMGWTWGDTQKAYYVSYHQQWWYVAVTLTNMGKRYVCSDKTGHAGIVFRLHLSCIPCRCKYQTVEVIHYKHMVDFTDNTQDIHTYHARISTKLSRKNLKGGNLISASLVDSAGLFLCTHPNTTYRFNLSV